MRHYLRGRASCNAGAWLAQFVSSDAVATTVEIVTDDGVVIAAETFTYSATGSSR